MERLRAVAAAETAATQHAVVAFCVAFGAKALGQPDVGAALALMALAIVAFKSDIAEAIVKRQERRAPEKEEES